MKTPIVYTQLSHGGRKYFRALKMDGASKPKESTEITKETYDHLIKYDGARKLENL